MLVIQIVRLDDLRQRFMDRRNELAIDDPDAELFTLAADAIGSVVADEMALASAEIDAAKLAAYRATLPGLAS